MSELEVDIPTPQALQTAYEERMAPNPERIHKALETIVAQLINGYPRTKLFKWPFAADWLQPNMVPELTRLLRASRWAVKIYRSDALEEAGIEVSPVPMRSTR